MYRLVAITLALGAACRGGHTTRDDAGTVPASPVSALVPKLPKSEDGAIELRMVDKRIDLARGQPRVEIGLLLERAAIRGRLADYQDAVSRSATWVETAPNDPAAWTQRVDALTRVHEFAAARAALATLRTLDHPKDVDELALALDEATGQLDRALAAREAAVKAWPNASNLVLYAATLALAGRYDDALATMPRAVTALRANTPQFLEWLLFQWGRIYEQKGELAAARAFYDAALVRLPGALEPTVHLARAQIATGDTAAAKRLVAAALAAERHPELLALAAELDADHRPALVAEATQAWERYLAALPLAFADHAARFYVGVGGDPHRARALADQNLANRDTFEARALAVEATLAAGDTVAACDVALALVRDSVPRPYRFVAWRALAACHRPEAEVLARQLGIAH
jgi:tetratricopeptide (TPR) repeat protein